MNGTNSNNNNIKNSTNPRNSKLNPRIEDEIVSTEGNNLKENFESNKENSAEFIDSKDWKTRKSIYSSILLSLESETAAELLQYPIKSKTDEKLGFYLPKILEDVLPQSLEVGLEAIIQFIEKDEEENYVIEDEIKFEIFKNAVEKAILSTKTPCKEKAKEIVMLLFELNPHMINTFMKYFVKVFESNKPKAIITSQQLIKDIIENFGCDQIGIEALYPSLNKLLDSANSGVRSEAIAIYREIYLFKRQELIPYIKYSKDLLKKEIENVFKKIENLEEPVPDITRQIKPIRKATDTGESSLLQSSEKKGAYTDKGNLENKNVKAFDSSANYESEDFSEKNRKACVEFIKKYNYLIVNDEFAIEQDSLQDFYNDLEAFYFNIQSFINESAHDNFLIESLFYESSLITSFLNLLNTILKIPLCNEANKESIQNASNTSTSKYQQKLLSSLKITEKAFAIVNIFHNKQDEKLKEFYCIIIESVIIKYIELEYLNNPTLYSRKASTGKTNSISGIAIDSLNNEEGSKINNTAQHQIDELKLNLKYSFLKLTYHIIETISFKKFLEMVSFDENEKENYTYLKIDLVSKILENLPFLNIEENLKNLVFIFYRNIDRSVKIDSIIYVCLKKLKILFGNSFNEKLLAINDENVSRHIDDFIAQHAKSHSGDKLKSSNLKGETKNAKTNKEDLNSKENEGEEKLVKNIKEEIKQNEIKSQNKINDIQDKEDKEDFAEIKQEKEEQQSLNAGNKNIKDDLIIIDMDEPKAPPKNIKNKFAKLKKGNEENNEADKKVKIEEKEKGFDNKITDAKSKKEILIVDDIVIGGKKNKGAAVDIENEDNLNNKINNKAEQKMNKNTKNNKAAEKEEIPEQDNFMEEEVDLKKKKEKDLKDFEKLLEEQMLLESKRLEEKGIDINDASASARKNKNTKSVSKKSTNTAANKAHTPDNNIEAEAESGIQIKKPAALTKLSESTNNLISVENSDLINDSTANNANTTASQSSTKNPKQSLNKKAEEKKQSTVAAASKPKDAAAGAKETKTDKAAEKEADDDEDKFAKLNKEEVESLINGLIGSEAAELLNSEKWNERKEGFAKIQDYIIAKKESGENLNSLKSNLDNLLVFIKIKLKGFKENNFNILREAFNIYTELIKLFAVKKAFERKTCTGILKAYWEKFSEAKVKEPLSNLLFTMMEYFTPNFVLNFLTKNLNEKTKSVALLKEYAQFFEKVIEEFGVGQIPVKDVVEFCKNLSANTNPQVRNSSTSLLCVLYKYIGKDLKTLLVKDIKEATYKLIETELDKVQVIAGAGAPVAKRNVVADEPEKKGAAGNLMDTLIPRVDISKKLTPKLIKDLNEGKWGDKKSAAEAIEKILADANNKIMHNGLNDLFLTVFKSKLNDGNKNVVRMMVQLITKLIDALGVNFKSMPNGVFKNITPLVIANLADKMLLLREDVLVCMDKWTQNAGIENIIIYIPEQLKIDNFELRTDLFKYLHKHKELIEKSAAAPQILKEFVSPIVKCLQDKTQQIRTSAEDFIIFSLKFISMNQYYAGLKDFKPAIQNDLKKLLDNAQANYQQGLIEKENLARENNLINNENENENNQGHINNNNNNNNNNNYSDEAASSSNSNLSVVNRNPPNPNRDLNSISSNNNLINLNAEGNINNNNIYENLNKNNSKRLIENISESGSINNIPNNINNNYNNNNNNDDSLKQDSKISSRNNTISHENLSSNSQILGNNNNAKPNSKKILVTKDKRAINEKSAEKKVKANTNNNTKTPETRQENNPYSNVTPDRQNVSNFAPGADKAKTPSTKNTQQIKNTLKNNNNNLNETNLNTNLNTINQEEILFTNNNNNSSCMNNSLAGNSQILGNNSKTLKNESKNLNNGVSPRVIGKTSTSNAAAALNKKNLGLQSWAIFQQQIQIKLSKEKRFEQDKKNKFNLDAPSDEYVNKLKENLNHIFISEYSQKLLSEDLKQNVEALSLITNYLIDYAQQTNYAFLDYLDIFLKWIFWKVNVNQNPSAIKAILELMEILAEIFISLDANFKLNDIEIYLIVNCLCEKLGNTSEKVREQAKEILVEKFFKFIFPMQKSASELCAVIQNTNKNAKMRLECLEILNYLWCESEQNNILATKDVKNLIKTLCTLKNSDAFKNKLQEFIFGFLFFNQENYLNYLTDLDPKTKETFTQKINAWIKTQNSLVANNIDSSQNLNTISYTNSKISNNNKDGSNTPSNTTPRVHPSNDTINPRLGNSNNANLNNSTFKNNNISGNNRRDFDTINKSDDNVNHGGSRGSVGPGQYTTRKEKPGKADDSNESLLNLTVTKKKSGLSPLNPNVKNRISNNNNNTNYNNNKNNEDLSSTAKANKSKNVISKIQNVNINSSMDESLSYYHNNNNNNNNKSITNNQLITTGNFFNNNNEINSSNNLKNKTYSLEDKEDLLSILDNLNNGSDNEKVNTILIIHDIIHAKFDVSKHILIPNIDEVINAFIAALKKLFEPAAHNIHEIPVKLGKYLITVLYKISSNKELIKNISYGTLFNLSEEVLSNLLIENLDKIGENQEGLVIIRSLNSTMLRVLENCDYTQVIEMLLDVVMKYRHSHEKSKISGLGIKCLLKIHQILEQIINQIKIDNLLLKVHLIFCEFEQTNGGLESENQTDQMIIRFIKNFIYELVKIKKEEIIVDYRLVDKHKQKDKYIKKWIKSILSSFENEGDKDKDKERVSAINSERTGSNSGVINDRNILNKSDIEDAISIGNLSNNRGNSVLNNRNSNNNNKILGDLSPNRIGNSVSPLKINSNNILNNNNNLNTNYNRNVVGNDYNINTSNHSTERDLSNEHKLSKINSNSEMNTRVSGNNLDALIAYKNKLKEVKDKELMNRPQMFESKYASTLSSDEMSESNREQISESNKKDNSSFYNQINKIKKKWENFSNNSRISNLNETMELNRSTISRNENIRLLDNQSNNNNNNNNNNLNVSQMTLNELKNKWNQVSNRTSNNSNRQNLNCSNINMNENTTHSTNQNSNSNIENKRKSMKK